MHTALSLVTLLDQAFTATNPQQKAQQLQHVLEQAQLNLHASGSRAYPVCVEAVCRLTSDKPDFGAVDKLFFDAMETTVQDDQRLCILLMWYRAMGWALRWIHPRPNDEPADPGLVSEAIPLFVAVSLMARQIGDVFWVARAKTMIARLHWYREEDADALSLTLAALSYMASMSKEGLTSSQADHYLTLGAELLKAASGVRPTQADLRSHLYLPGELLAAMGQWAVNQRA